MQQTRKKKLGGYPAVGVVMSVTLALFVIGLFGLLTMYSRKLEVLVRENIKLQVYLKSGLTNTQRLQVENKLLAMDFVNTNDGRGITFVPKEEAAKKFIAETGEDFTKFIGDNPLKDAYLVNVDPSYHSVQEMEKLKKEIQEMAGVFEVYYVEGLIDSINQNVTKISIVLASLVLILLITVILLINNTLRLALFSQRFLIRSMQLVGARRWFIQRPFLARAAGYGLLAGAIASGVLYLITDYAGKNIQDLNALFDIEEFLKLCIVLLITGVIVSTTSTYFSIKKYLRMSLDELY